LIANETTTQYRTASRSDRMLSLNERYHFLQQLGLASGRYRSRFCNAHYLLLCNAAFLLIGNPLASSIASAQKPAREQWGAMAVAVSHTGDKWTIAGRKNKVSLNEVDLGLSIQAGPAQWAMMPSAQDMLVRSRGEEFYLRLADARKITIVRYDTGFKTGVKISLGQWGHQGADLDLTLFLTICLEGSNEELVFDAAASEQETGLIQLDWPGALDAREVDYTVLSNGRGTLLPRNWPKEYFPIRTITPEGKIAGTDHSLLQSHVIESWSMSWWGFQKGRSAAMVIVETPDDASYQFSHPAGGPTVIGPR
jgi:hypothetical protein